MTFKSEQRFSVGFSFRLALLFTRALGTAKSLTTIASKDAAMKATPIQSNARDP
jgi:hypothetical protein